MAQEDLVKVEEKAGVRIMCVKGHIDLETAPRIKPHFMEESKVPHCRIVLDMEGVHYISSFGLSLLLQLNERVKASNGRLALAALQTFAKQVFDTTQLNVVFKVYDTVEAAVKALSQKE